MSLSRWFIGCIATLASAQMSMPVEACYEVSVIRYTDSFGIKYSAALEDVKDCQSVVSVPLDSVQRILALTPPEARVLSLKAKWFAILGEYFFRSKEKGSFMTANRLLAKAAELESLEHQSDSVLMAAYLDRAKAALNAELLTTRRSGAVVTTPQPSMMPRTVINPVIH